MGIISSSQKPKVVQHYRLGNVQIGSFVTNQETITILRVTQALPSFDPVLEWLTIIRDISPLYKLSKITSNRVQNQMHFHFKQSPQTLNLSSIFLPLSYRWKQEGLCGSGGTFTVQYQCLMFDLQSEVLNRQQQGKYFLQTQMWYLLYKLIELLKQFCTLKKKVGNLHLRNILIDDQGRIKVITKYSVLAQLDGYQQKLQDLNSSAFLSPQQIDDLNQRLSQPSNHQKSQIYSLAITILAVGTLSQGDHFYQINYESKQLITIDHQLIRRKLTSFKEHYSTFLSSLLQTILKLNPNERKSPAQIYDSLKQYQKDILDLHPFIPNWSHYQQRKLNQTNIKEQKLSYYSNNQQYQHGRSSIKKYLNQ